MFSKKITSTINVCCCASSEEFALHYFNDDFSHIHSLKQNKKERKKTSPYFSAFITTALTTNSKSLYVSYNWKTEECFYMCKFPLLSYCTNLYYNYLYQPHNSYCPFLIDVKNRMIRHNFRCSVEVKPICQCSNIDEFLQHHSNNDHSKMHTFQQSFNDSCPDEVLAFITEAVVQMSASHFDPYNEIPISVEVDRETASLVLASKFTTVPIINIRR